MVCNECGAHIAGTTGGKNGKKVIKEKLPTVWAYWTKWCYESLTLKEEVIQEIIMGKFNSSHYEEET